MPVFFNTQNETAGAFSIINPASYNENTIFIGSFYNFQTIDLITNYLGYNKKLKNINIGFLFSENINNILNQYSFSPFINYSINKISIGFGVESNMLMYVDNVNVLQYGLKIGNHIEHDNLISETMIHYFDNNFYGQFLIALNFINYDVFINTNYIDRFIYTAGFDFNINNILSIGLSFDNENRIIGNFEFNKLYYKIKYSYLIQNELGISHSMEIKFIFPDRNIEYTKITIPKRKKIKYNIKIEKQIPFNINEANIYDLMKIPGIGYKIAKKIYEKRLLNGNYKSYNEINNIYGIGRKMLEKIKQYTYIGE